jgi:hypothetical protein
MPPNPRLQRTRAARSPLSRKPLGGQGTLPSCLERTACTACTEAL